MCYSREVTVIYIVLKKRLAYPLLKHRSCHFPRSLEKLPNHLAVKMTIACPWIYGWSTARSGWCRGVGWWGGGWWQTLGNPVGPYIEPITQGSKVQKSTNGKYVTLLVCPCDTCNYRNAMNMTLKLVSRINWKGNFHIWKLTLFIAKYLNPHLFQCWLYPNIWLKIFSLVDGGTTSVFPWLLELPGAHPTKLDRDAISKGHTIESCPPMGF